jgi:ATP-dependent Clp protease ATP-binding subunit ClpC
MFERFTDRARGAVDAAQVQARDWGHGWVGTEHLLWGLADGDGLAARSLSQLGFDRPRFERAVLDEVGKFGPAVPGHIPFTPRIKSALAASLRIALGMSHNYIGTEHLLIALLEDDSSLATKLLAEQGVSASTVTPVVTALLSGIAADQVTSAGTSDANSAEPLEHVQMQSTTAVAHCPGCGQPLASNLGAEVIPSVGDVERSFTVAFCRACGHVLAVLPED